MDMIDSSRRGFLKSAVAAGAAVMASAAANAGIPASSVKKYDETFDVVIIGSGFAGMACAYKAAQAGLKILMLEKMSVVGGNSAICGGNVACPANPVQKAQASTIRTSWARSLTAATTPSRWWSISAANSFPTTCSLKAATPFRVLMKSRPAPVPVTSARCTPRCRSFPTS